jgi:hypothetical protein
MWSDEARVMIRPAGTYAAIGLQSATAADHPQWPLWLAWRRPVFIALFIGACLSLAATNALTLRLTLSAAVAWSFVPIIEIAALAIVVRGPSAASSRGH